MLHLLGTGAPFPIAHRTTTMLAFHDAGRTLLVDCGGDAVQRLLQAGLAPESVCALVITHEHADHTAGFPLLLEKLWLGRRTAPLPVIGIAEAIAQVRRLWDAYRIDTWKNLFPVDWRVVPEEEGALLYEDDVFRVTGAPGVHSVPSMGVRVAAARTGRVCTYSCDTEPCEAIIRLAEGADLLVHEATGAGPGHSSAHQAARVAWKAGVSRLVLVHLPAAPSEADLAAARAIVEDTTLGQDGAFVVV